MSNLRSLKERVWKRDGVKCRYCGKQLLMPPRGTPTHDVRYATVDHVVPVSKGGRSVLRNLLTACTGCNRAKGTRDAMDFRIEAWGAQA